MDGAKVVLVEDDFEVRRRLTVAISSSHRLHLAAAVGSVAEARSALARLRPDILLVDLGLPDGRGTDLIRDALTIRPDIQVMVITVFADETNVVSAIEAGATSYLLKDASYAHVSRAIDQMMSGGSPISASVARYLLRRFQGPPRPDALPRSPSPAAHGAQGAHADESALFSVRETDVLNLVAKGLSYVQIGDELGITVNTVGTYIKQIYRKLSVNSRGQAVYQARARGLIDGANPGA